MSEAEYRALMTAAADAIEAEAGKRRTEWDRCTCGGQRSDHASGVGCMGPCCWYAEDDQCKRFTWEKRDKLGLAGRKAVEFLRREAGDRVSA